MKMFVWFVLLAFIYILSKMDGFSLNSTCEKSVLHNTCEDKPMQGQSRFTGLKSDMFGNWLTVSDPSKPGPGGRCLSSPVETASEPCRIWGHARSSFCTAKYMLSQLWALESHPKSLNPLYMWKLMCFHIFVSWPVKALLRMSVAVLHFFLAIRNAVEWRRSKPPGFTAEVQWTRDLEGKFSVVQVYQGLLRAGRVAELVTPVKCNW